MHYVILRDDDTNAFTPIECLERLYRPFLERGLPVNLAAIPAVRTDAVQPNGRPERFLLARNVVDENVPLGTNQPLVRYLLANPGFHVVQHGCDHSLFEFDSNCSYDVTQRLDRGTRLLAEAGLPPTRTFVAPYDRLSRVSLRAVASRFRVLSTGWFELRRLPLGWWPGYLGKRILRHHHWRIGSTALLSHPGCLLSNQRPYHTMLEQIKKAINRRQITVLVTHWWEYFPDCIPDEDFIEILHQTARYLASRKDVSVVSFEQVGAGAIPLN